MAGQFARASRRSGGIQAALEPIMAVLAQKREEQKQKDYIKGLLDAFVSTQGKMEDIQNPQIKKELIPQDSQQVDFTRRNALDNPNQGTSFRSNLPTGEMNVLQKIIPGINEPKGYQRPELQTVEQPQGDLTNDVILKELGEKLDSKTYNVSGNMFPQTKEKLMKKMITDFQVKQLFDAENQKYVNPEKINALANVLYSKLPQKPEMMNVSQGTDVIGYNRETGEIKTIYQNKKEEDAKENPLDKKIDEYTNSSNDKIVIFQKPNGETYERKFGKVRETKNITNIKNKLPQPEKWKGFGKTISDARRKFNSTKEGIEQLLPEEINKNWDDAKAEYLSTMLPQAKIWFEDNIVKKNLTTIPNKQYLQKIYDAVNKEELTVEEGQDLIDANAYRSDLYGK